MNHASKGQLSSRTKGVTLLEALIALAVVSVGLLAIAKLHGELITGAAETKTRSEAVRLASAEIERLRGNPTRLAAESNTDTHEGTNANFEIERSILIHPDAGTNPALHTAQVTVSWDSPWGPRESVEVASNIAWDDLGDIGNIARGRLPGGEQDGPRSGRELTGREPLDPTNPDVTSRTVFEDYEERYSDEDGRRQIVRADDVIIEIADPDGIGFASISGFVFRTSDHADLDLEDFEVVRSDTRTVQACINNRIDAADVTFEGGSVANVLGLTGPGASVFNGNAVMFYQCFAGSNWYGNTELLRREFSATGRQPTYNVCLGDPDDTEPTGYPAVDWGSRHLIEIDRRRYRAETSNRGIRQGVELGVQTGLTVPQEALPREDFYNPSEADDDFGHHFVLAESGQCDNLPEGLKELLTANKNIGQNYCFNPTGDNHDESCLEPGF
ncbi:MULTISPECIES: prepilin-type N-terminal cleavage/methylation domain-containing protein [unclassified Thioalkalivibrio]|uniref:type IV pilus modification PilV family protein n=1 Tax=unclassified Thioalkalivibrio TaxID=2621013 RepID=UPI0003607D49|nr:MULTISPECIES: prepilin-type N-terminal cleavage/methylation domain-containing protein [unclassified Thioalkalivibrio]